MFFLLQNQMITALTALAEKIENLQADVDEIKLKVDHMMPSYWRKKHGHYNNIIVY